MIYKCLLYFRYICINTFITLVHYNNGLSICTFIYICKFSYILHIYDIEMPQQRFIIQ